MLEEILGVLRPVPGGVYVDATLGGGGVAAAIAARGAAMVYGIDRDPAACAAARDLFRSAPVEIINGCFSDMGRYLDARGVDRVDGIVFDPGVSSPQLDTPERGFSFTRDGPIDMRMSGSGTTAAELLARLPEAALAAMFRDYGEERHARRIARAIVRERATTPLTRTRQLAALVSGVAGSQRGPGNRRHPATRIFQALRIAVNNELELLEQGLEAAGKRLKPAGRLVALSFHSLEDRIVKRFLARHAGKAGVPRHLPPETGTPAPVLALPRDRFLRPSGDEIAINPRARSAKLRYATRLPEDGSCKN